MNADGRVLCGDDLRGAWAMFWRGFLLWPVCLIRGHQWQKTDHWVFLDRGLVDCWRCCASQFLSDVPRKWDGKWESRSTNELIPFLVIVLCFLPLVALS